MEHQRQDGNEFGEAAMMFMPTGKGSLKDKFTVVIFPDTQVTIWSQPTGYENACASQFTSASLRHRLKPLDVLNDT